MERKHLALIVAVAGIAIAAASFFYPWYKLNLVLNIPDAPTILIQILIGGSGIEAMSENPQVNTLLGSLDLKGEYAKYVFYFIIAIALIGVLRRKFLRTGLGLMMYVLGIYLLLYLYPYFAPSLSTAGEILTSVSVELLTGGYLLLAGGVMICLARFVDD